jgi:cell division protease FtsH
MLVRTFFPQPDAPLTVPYTVFREEVGLGNVWAIYSRGTTIEGRFRKPVTWPTPEQARAAGASPPRTALDRRLLPPPRTSAYFSTELPAFFDRSLEGFLVQHNVEISAVPIQQGGLWNTLLYFGPALLIIGFYLWMYRRAALGGGLGMGGMFGLGLSKARRYDADPANRVTFDDVAGIDEAEAELVEIVDFLKAPQKYTRLGGTAPKGVLLVAYGTSSSRHGTTRRRSSSLTRSMP